MVRIRNIFIVFLFSLLVLQGQIRIPVTNAATTKPYVDEIMIRDPNGHPLRLYGFNIDDEVIDEEGFQWLKNKGFNYVRISFFWHRYENASGVYDSVYLSKIDNMLALCQKYGIYATIVFQHWQWSPYFSYYNGQGTGFPAWLISEGGYANSSTGLQAFLTEFYLNEGHGATVRQKFFQTWEQLVNRYKDNPYVFGYEILNESTIAKGVPLDLTIRQAIMEFYEDFTSRIRLIDSETVIIYHSIGQADRKTSYSNIAWTKSWYDVQYGGYYPTSEKAEIVNRIQILKDLYNTVCGAPFLLSEMGFKVGTTGGSQWIKDSFNTMRSLGLNDGYECCAWYIYSKGPKSGYECPRELDGSDTFIVDILRSFGLGPETLTVTSPNGGERWVSGTTHELTWVSAGYPSDVIKIELVKPGVANKVIVSSTPNDGSFDWAIPITQALGSDYKLRVTGTVTPAGGSIATDSSDAYFSLIPETLTVTSPNGGESWVGGTIHEITWTSTGSSTAAVTIELVKPGVANKVIVSSTPNNGSYDWAIPMTQALGSDYRVKITRTTFPVGSTAATDSSNADFAIIAEGLTVTSPKGGESWVSGTTHTITWSSTGSSKAPVKIELVRPGAANRVIVASTPNDGSYDWTIPMSQALGSDYSIKITRTTYPTGSTPASDTSDSYFTLIPESLTLTSPNGGENLVSGTRIQSNLGLKR